MIATLTNAEAERGLIGSALIAPDRVADLDRIAPEDFAGPAHRSIWRAILSVSGRSAEFDSGAILAELAGRGELDERTRSVLAEAEAATPSAVNAEHFADAVASAAVRRSVLRACERLREQIADPTIEVGEIIAETERALLAVGDQRTSDPAHLVDAVREALAQIDAERKGATPDRAPSGLRMLDELIGGVGRGELAILAARPGVGKSSLAWQWAIASAGAGFGAFFVSLEMRQAELARRWIASSARVAQAALKSQRLSDLQMARMMDAAGKSPSLPVWLADSTRQTIGEIRSAVRRWKRRRPELALVIVDYLQLVQADRGRMATREQEVSAVARGLKQLAREADVGVLALSQLSREQEKAGREPMLSDLRESGEIEQAADCVLFVHREKDSTPGADEAASFPCRIVVAKQRNGASGVAANVAFRSAWTLFEDR